MRATHSGHAAKTVTGFQQTPDGRLALLRFYDARLMAALAAAMQLTRRIQFFVTTFDWLVEINGKPDQTRTLLHSAA